MANPDRIEATARVTGGTQYTASDVASNLYKSYATQVSPMPSAGYVAANVNQYQADRGMPSATIGLDGIVKETPWVDDTNNGGFCRFYSYNRPLNEEDVGNPEKQVRFYSIA